MSAKLRPDIPYRVYHPQSFHFSCTPPIRVTRRKTLNNVSNARINEFEIVIPQQQGSHFVDFEESEILAQAQIASVTRELPLT